jgi:hypothetical protein
MDMDALKDDSSWRRLTTLLHEIAVSDEQLATMRARLMARLQEANDAPDDTLDAKRFEGLRDQEEKE